MALPEPVRRSAEERVQEFCDRRIPPHLQDQIRLESSLRWNAITLAERRLPWRPDFGPEWSTLKVAQLRYDQSSEKWTLWWSDRNEQWHLYEDVDPSPDVRPLLREIDEDPTGIFWG